ncbi:MAG: lipopolysaccharide transport periplasmic protein LptA [Arcobacteraceae bacterium]
MKIIFTLLISFIFLFANNEDKLIIDSNNFESDDSKGIAIFTGNVKMLRAKDKLNGNKVTVYLSNATKENTKREAIKYVAIGNVSFEIFTELKHYEGKGDKVIYLPKQLQYEIIGNGYLKDITEDKTIIGETIFIDQKTGNATVKGSKEKPVRFILNIESSNKNENN